MNFTYQRIYDLQILIFPSKGATNLSKTRSPTIDLHTIFLIFYQNFWLDLKNTVYQGIRKIGPLPWQVRVTHVSSMSASPAYIIDILLTHILLSFNIYAFSYINFNLKVFHLLRCTIPTLCVIHGRSAGTLRFFSRLYIRFYNIYRMKVGPFFCDGTLPYLIKICICFNQDLANFKVSEFGGNVQRTVAVGDVRCTD